MREHSAAAVARRSQQRRIHGTRHRSQPLRAGTDAPSCPVAGRWPSSA